MLDHGTKGCRGPECRLDHEEEWVHDWKKKVTLGVKVGLW